MVDTGNPGVYLGYYPMEIIDMIIMRVHPRDYSNFIIGLGSTGKSWFASKNNRRRYFSQFLDKAKKIRGNYVIKYTVNKNGEKHGICRKYRRLKKSMKIDTLVHYHNGIMHGKYFKYHRNGKIKHELNYHKGKQVGISLAYWENGALSCKTLYKDNAVRRHKQYYNNGVLELESEYNSGKLHGPHLRYYSDGKAQEYTNYCHGKRSGKMFTFSQDGKLERLSIYKNGSLVETQKISGS